MSIKFKFTIALLLALALVLPMFLKGPDGRPIMTFSDWLPETSGLAHFLQGTSVAENSLPPSNTLISADASVAEPGKPDAAAGMPTLGAGKLYKWQDEHGHWHFSNEKPAHTERVTVETLPEIENVMERPVTSDKKSNAINLPGGFGLGGH